MTNKTSQKTEDEMLDQTFGANEQTFDHFAEEITSEASDNTKTGGKKSAKKSGSSNTVLFAAGGVAAVLIIGYMFIIKPMRQQAQAPSNIPVVVDTQQPQTPQVPESQPAVPNIPSAPTVTPESQAAQDFLNGSSVKVQQPQVLIPESVSPNITINQGVPIGQPTQNAPVNVPNSNNSDSIAIVDELTRRFSSQNEQFIQALNEIGSKVSELDGFKIYQTGINKNVEERLIKLEGQKSSVKKFVKKSVPRKAKVTEKESVISNIREIHSTGNILVDKSDVRTIRKNNIETKEISLPSVNYNVHSIYGGRVWFKNPDGSLSTFTSGDKLPSGEIIKSIDDEKFSITTNKRTINKN